jgi:hypothetical protein
MVVKEVLKHNVHGLLPAHGLTTIHYILTKYIDKQRANQEVDWLLARFEVAPIGKSIFVQARNLNIDDFEDAVVAVLADVNGCDYIISRNDDDFEHSPVPALTPEDFVKQHVSTSQSPDS